MPPVDVFTAQRRTDEFRAALGNVGGHVSRSAELDALLDQADRHGWTPTALGEFIAQRLPRSMSSPAGLVLTKLRDLASTVRPPAPHPHAVDAQTRARRAGGVFVQPLPPCGACDGSPARWRDVTPPGHKGQRQVRHCPTCWTAPPGYVPPRTRLTG